MCPQPLRPWPVYARRDSEECGDLLGTVRARNAFHAIDIARRKFPKRSYRGAHLSVPLDPTDIPFLLPGDKEGDA